MESLSLEMLKELLSYDPETGVLNWLVDRGRKAKAGDRAGSLRSNGYRTIGVCGRYYSEHRLIWFYMTGRWPASDIDHRDNRKDNNRWSNLRSVSEHHNLQNQRRAHHTNKCGLLGVSPNGQKWQARIRVDGKSMHLGSFESPALAHEAYVNAKRLLHPGCTI